MLMIWNQRPKIHRKKSLSYPQGLFTRFKQIKASGSEEVYNFSIFQSKYHQRMTHYTITRLQDQFIVLRV